MSGALGDKKYRVIYADPPWTFSTYSEKGKGRSAEAYYDCMSLDDIKKLPVAQWAADDAILLLWVTDPLLEKAFEVIRAWGFTYKTVGFYWVKLNRSGTGFFTGLGFWTRANPEQCLLATRGNPKRKSADVPKLVVAPAASTAVSRMRCTRSSNGSPMGPISSSSPARTARAGTPGEPRWACSTAARYRSAAGHRRPIPTSPSKRRAWHHPAAGQREGLGVNSSRTPPRSRAARPLIH